MSRSKVKVTGDKKTKKCGILFVSRPLGRGPLRWWESQRMLSSYKLYLPGSRTNARKYFSQASFARGIVCPLHCGLSTALNCDYIRRRGLLLQTE